MTWGRGRLRPQVGEPGPDTRRRWSGRTDLGGKHGFIVQETLSPGHEGVDVLRRRERRGLLVGGAVLEQELVPAQPTRSARFTDVQSQDGGLPRTSRHDGALDGQVRSHSPNGKQGTSGRTVSGVQNSVMVP